MTTHPLRDYQVKMIDRIEAQIKYGKRRIMLQLPTGAGKTRCFVELAKRHRLNPYASDRNCLIVAHRKELIDQAVEALTKEGVKKWEIGIIRANVQESRHCVIQVASIQSLIRREFPKAGLVIIDEAHHATADSYQTIIDHYQDSIILGVTATPARTDGKGFKGSFEILLEGPTVKALTTQNYLCPYKLYAYTKQRIDTRSVKIQAGDYQLNQLADVVMQSEVRADLVETWKKHAFGKKTVVFAVNVELSKQYAAIYNAAGYKAEHIDGDTPENQRVAILSRFKHGHTKILCNCNIVTEGFDLPEMECVQIVRPTKSLILWLQMVGRSLRTAEGKSHAIILDHTDNYKRLGLPDGNRQWSLNGVTFSGFTPSFESREGDTRRQREIQHKEGELVEIYSNEDVPIKSSQPVREERPTKKALWIDGMRWDVDSKIASVISQKLDRLEELEKVILEKDTQIQQTLEDLSESKELLLNINIHANEQEEILKNELIEVKKDLAETRKLLRASESRVIELEKESKNLEEESSRNCKDVAQVQHEDESNNLAHRLEKSNILSHFTFSQIDLEISLDDSAKNFDKKQYVCAIYAKSLIATNDLSCYWQHVGYIMRLQGDRIKTVLTTNIDSLQGFKVIPDALKTLGLFETDNLRYRVKYTDPFTRKTTNKGSVNALQEFWMQFNMHCISEVKDNHVIRLQYHKPK